MTESYEDRFNAIVREAFAPLSIQYGLSLVSSRRLLLTFASDRVELVVSQKHIWDCLDISLGRSKEGAFYDLKSIVLWSGTQPQPQPLQIGSTSVLRESLAGVVSFLQRRAGALFRGSDDAFAEIAAIADARDAAYHYEMTVGLAIHRARQAWRSHEYGRVVDILSAIGAPLSETDALRLRLAAKFLETETDRT